MAFEPHSVRTSPGASASLPATEHHASLGLLMSMLAEPPRTWVGVEIDRCPRCRCWLEARWSPSADACDATGFQRYVLAVACAACAFGARTQHAMSRRG